MEISGAQNNIGTHCMICPFKTYNSSATYSKKEKCPVEGGDFVARDEGDEFKDAD